MAKKNRSRRPSVAPAAAAAATATPATSDAAFEPAFEAGGVQADTASGAFAAEQSSDAADYEAGAASSFDSSIDVRGAAESHDAQTDESTALGNHRDFADDNAPVAAAAASSAATPRAIDPGSQLGSSQPSWSQHSSEDIRGVLIQVAGGRLLLPNATIAEVLSYSEPEPVESAPEWLLGRFRWRGWQLPLVAFSRLSGIGEDNPGLGSKVIVLKSLGGDSRAPYFAVITQGFPRLVTVSRDALHIDAQGGELPAGVQAFVRLNDEPALLPDLMQIEQRLRETREAA